MKQKDNPYSKRACFPKGEQGRFLCEALMKLRMSESDLASVVGVHKRTLNGWKREETSMSYQAVLWICKELEIGIPKSIEIKDPFWYVNKGSKKAWQTNLLKYGGVPVNEEHRKKKWHQWWEMKGKYSNSRTIGITKSIQKPCFSKDLAEFAGILMGDGGITRNQVIVTLNSVDDKLYSEHVDRLFKNLFGVPVTQKVVEGRKALKLVVSRTELVNFCNKKLGLIIGHKVKQGLDIPSWIYDDINFQKRCLRGLVDTDGCIFYERHIIKGKVYSYPRLNFTSASPALVSSVVEILRGFGLSPKVRRKGRSVQLEKKEEIRQYFNTIGTSNPKHEERFIAG